MIEKYTRRLRLIPLSGIFQGGVQLEKRYHGLEIGYSREHG